jgi:hypothetical protein
VVWSNKQLANCRSCLQDKAFRCPGKDKIVPGSDFKSELKNGMLANQLRWQGWGACRASLLVLQQSSNTVAAWQGAQPIAVAAAAERCLDMF